MKRLLVVYNAKSGREDQLEIIKKAFARYRVMPEYIAIGDRTLRRKLRQASEERDMTVVAAGGDGTVNCVAQYVHGTDCRLGIIPAGTLNHFAKALGLPLDITAAVRVVVEGKPARVDVGLVNKHVFVNNASIGFYPRSVRIRDEYGRLIGKWPAAVLGFVSSAIRPRHYHATLRVDGRTQTFRTPFVFIGNNEYQRAQPDIGERASLDKGQLAVYVVKATAPLAIIRGVMHALFTKKRQSKDFAMYITDSCTIRTRHQQSITIATDGEVLVTRTPLRYRSEPRGLRVLRAK